MLGLAPLRWVGKISFSLYLWHWPVIVIAEQRSSTPLSTVERFGCAAMTLALSATSFYLVEHPLRSSALLRPKGARNSWERSRKALLVGAIAIAIAVGVSALTHDRAAVAIDRASRRPEGTSAAASSLVPTLGASVAAQVAALQSRVAQLVREGLALRRIPDDVNPPVLRLQRDPRFSACLQFRRDVTVKPCTFGDTASKRILVAFGDSHAMEWMPALDAYGRQAAYRVITVNKEACPVPDIDVYTGQAPGQPAQTVVAGAYPECTTWRAHALEYIRSLKPVAVVLAFGGENTTPEAFEESTWLSGLRGTMRKLAATGAHIVEIGTNSQLSQDPGQCLSRKGADPTDCQASFLDTVRLRIHAESVVVRSEGGGFIDVRPWMCVDTHCPVIIDHRIAYADFGHLSPQYVLDVQPLLAASFRSEGLR